MYPLGAVRGLGAVALLAALWGEWAAEEEAGPGRPCPEGTAGGSSGEEPRTRRRSALVLGEEDLALLDPYLAQGLIVGK